MWTSLCELNELVEAKGKYVEINGFQLAVFRYGDNVYVMDNTCPHAGGPLAEGDVEDGCAVCPWHGWNFQLESGELVNAPGVKIRTYPARIYTRAGESALVQADLPIY
jgi:NAD(P)H-dependent nitrite reductase small subunit